MGFSCSSKPIQQSFGWDTAGLWMGFGWAFPADGVVPSSARESWWPEAVIGNYPCLPEKVAGGGARREAWQEGLWCTRVAAVARAAGDALAHSGHPPGHGPVQCVVA